MRQARRAGAFLRWSDKLGGDVGSLEFVLLQDRSRSPQYPDPGCACLVLTGEVYGAGVGGVVRLRGIVDASEEIAWPLEEAP